MSEDVPVTITEIREWLTKNPPGQGCCEMDMEFIYAAPFYITFLLDALEAPTRKRKKLLANGCPRSLYLERTKAAGWHSAET